MRPTSRNYVKKDPASALAELAEHGSATPVPPLPSPSIPFRVSLDPWFTDLDGVFYGVSYGHGLFHPSNTDYRLRPGPVTTFDVTWNARVIKTPVQTTQIAPSPP